VSKLSDFFVLEPEVAGGLGQRTILERTAEGPRVTHLHYEFGPGWQGDDLATSHPVFIVSDRVGSILREARLTGMALTGMEQSVDAQAYEIDPNLKLPAFRWLQVNGRAGVDDFGTDAGYLVVSKRALDLLRRNGRLTCCEIRPRRPTS